MRNKKEKSVVSYVDDRTSIVRDFIRRSPFESYRCMDYYLPDKIQEKTVYPMLDCCLKKLLPGADDGNLNMLNHKLLSVGFQAMAELERQRITHQEMIHRLSARRKADHHDLVQMLNIETQNLHQLQEEYKRTCDLLAQHMKGDSH